MRDERETRFPFSYLFSIWLSSMFYWLILINWQKKTSYVISMNRHNRECNFHGNTDQKATNSLQYIIDIRTTCPACIVYIYIYKPQYFLKYLRIFIIYRLASLTHSLTHKNSKVLQKVLVLATYRPRCVIDRIIRFESTQLSLFKKSIFKYV